MNLYIRGARELSRHRRVLAKSSKNNESFRYIPKSEASCVKVEPDVLRRPCTGNNALSFHSSNVARALQLLQVVCKLAKGRSVEADDF